MMIFAVTGPRHINDAQKYIVGRQIRQAIKDIDLLITGSAFGVDTYACEFADKMHGINQLLCVPDDPHNKDLVERMKDKANVVRLGSYRERNQYMMDHCDILLAFPASPKEILRSGTWMTIRMARKQGIPIWINPLDGSESYEDQIS